MGLYVNVSMTIFPIVFFPICFHSVFWPSKFAVPKRPTEVPTKYRVSFPKGIIYAVLQDGPFPEPDGFCSRLPATFSKLAPPSVE